MLLPIILARAGASRDGREVRAGTLRRRTEAHVAEFDRNVPRQRLVVVRIFFRVARRYGARDLRGRAVVGKLQALELFVGERAGLVDEVAPFAVVAETGQVERLAQLGLVLWVLFDFP